MAKVMNRGAKHFGSVIHFISGQGKEFLGEFHGDLHHLDTSIASAPSERPAPSLSWSACGERSKNP
jgi:hypothetical protein